MQRFLLHRDVAVRIRRGATDERHVDRQGFVEEELLAAEGDQLDDFLEGGGVHSTAFQARIDEGAEAHLGERSGLAGANVAVEVRDDALGQVIREDLVVLYEATDLGREPEVAADHAPQQALVGEPVEPFLLGIPLARCMHEREAARGARLKEALLERGQQLLRHSMPAVAGRCEHVAILEHRDRVLDRNDLLEHLSRSHDAPPVRPPFSADSTSAPPRAADRTAIRRSSRRGSPPRLSSS